jgi:hypothetical protein
MDDVCEVCLPLAYADSTPTLPSSCCGQAPGDCEEAENQRLLRAEECGRRMDMRPNQGKLRSLTA